MPRPREVEGVKGKMSILKLIKYPGAKSALLPQISKTFRESNADVFVDVFGGSGIVSLNIDSLETVYNDLNVELYELFLVIKSHPDVLLEEIKKWTGSSVQFSKYDEIFNAKGMINLTSIDRAFRTFYGFNIGFGGMGSTYKTKKEKSSYSSILKIVSNYNTIASKISKWKVENLDFRKLIEKYDREGVFFYYDPPYSGKSWYEFGFDEKDLEELGQVTANIKGKYLLSSDYNDEAVKKIFGAPDLTIEFENQNRRKDSEAPHRKFSFYSNL